MSNTVLITGGTGKLGRAMFTSFIKANWAVVGTSRDSAKLEALIAECAPQNSGAHGLTVELLSADAIDTVMEELDRKKLVITHVVNNARSRDSLAVKDGGVTARSDFMAEFELGVAVPYELTMRIAKSPRHKLRSVVNMGSIYGLVAPNPVLTKGSLENSPIQYGVSKAGLHHMTRELAVRLAPQAVRVNCVAFGGFEGRADEEFAARYGSLAPSGRMLKDSEVFGPVEFLLGEASSSVNGHVLVADGGWSIW